MLRAFSWKNTVQIVGMFVAVMLTMEIAQAILPGLASIASAQDAAAKEPESMLMWTYNALGIRYTVTFLAISFAFGAGNHELPGHSQRQLHSARVDR